VTRSADRGDVFATILLSLAALCTSWAGYQATRWSGEQAQRSAEAAALRAKSSRASVQSGQLVLLDIAMFNWWLRERVAGDSMLARFLEERFRPEFKAAFETWLASNPLRSLSAAPTPFSLPVYRLESRDSASAYESAADSASTLSRAANRTGDGYVLAAVMLATVMFFATSAQQAHHRLRWVLVVIATASFLVGTIRLFTLPRA
jgi:hypothetical protein